MMTLVSLLKKKARNQLRIWSNWKPQKFSEAIQHSRQEHLQFVAEVHQGKM